MPLRQGPAGERRIREPAQRIHRDQWAFDFFPFPSGYKVQCNTIWAMNDFSEENGAMRVIPASNRFADRLQFGEADTVAAEMPAGSLVFYTGSLDHGAGANRSDHVRYGLDLAYALGYLDDVRDPLDALHGRASSARLGDLEQAAKHIGAEIRADIAAPDQRKSPTDAGRHSAERIRQAPSSSANPRSKR